MEKQPTHSHKHYFADHSQELVRRRRRRGHGRKKEQRKPTNLLSDVTHDAQLPKREQSTISHTSPSEFGVELASKDGSRTDPTNYSNVNTMYQLYLWITLSCLNPTSLIQQLS